jgi:OTU domain-containing protein 6
LIFGGMTGCGCFIFVFEDFEMDVQLSEEELLQTHRKERNELQGIIQALKKTCTKGDKRKKEVTEEIIRLELELEKGQNEELFHLKQEAAVCEEHANEDCGISQHARVSKAQRRRDKKASRERQRENMIMAQ